MKILQTMRFVFLVSIVLYGVVAARFSPTSAEHGNTFFFEVITLVAVMCVVGIFVFRRLTVARAMTALGNNPNDQGALARWRAGYVVTYAMAEAIALYGVVLRFTGFSTTQVLPFFIAGFVLVLFFGPRRPVDAIG